MASSSWHPGPRCSCLDCRRQREADRTGIAGGFATLAANQAAKREARGFVVEVWNGRRWAKVRGPEGGPWQTRDRAERIAASRENSERRASSTEGFPHRVAERSTSG